MALRRTRTRADGAEEVHVLEGLHPVLEALKARRRRLYGVEIDASWKGRGRATLEEAAAEAGVPVREVSELRRRARKAGAESPSGVSLRAGPLPVSPLNSFCSPSDHRRLLVAVDGVEDPQNLGALARVCDAAGVGGMLLTKRRAPPLSPAVSRASAGALEWIPTCRVSNLARALNVLKERGFWVIGGDPSAATSLYDLPLGASRGDLVVVLGGEERGIRPGLQGLLDYPVRIPMAGKVESLNVAAASAVLLFELSRRLADSPEDVGKSPSLRDSRR